jgi:hypothetical protein
MSALQTFRHQIVDGSFGSMFVVGKMFVRSRIFVIRKHCRGKKLRDSRLAMPAMHDGRSR